MKVKITLECGGDRVQFHCTAHGNTQEEVLIKSALNGKAYLFRKPTKRFFVSVVFLSSYIISIFKRVCFGGLKFHTSFKMPFVFSFFFRFHESSCCFSLSFLYFPYKATAFQLVSAVLMQLCLYISIWESKKLKTT